MVVLVGPPAAGKTTVRRALLAAGLPQRLVVSLDDLRRELRRNAVTAGRPAREVQDWTTGALRVAAARQQALLAERTGYLADATHLRRRERRAHVVAAHAAGLPAVALLLDEHPPHELAGRNAGRSADEVVPERVLLAMAHRRSLLTPASLAEEGFDVVLPVRDSTRFDVRKRGGRGSEPRPTLDEAALAQPVGGRGQGPAPTVSQHLQPADGAAP